MKIKNCFFFILVLASSQSLLAQGPWAKGKGHGYSQLTYNTIPTYTTIYSGDNGTRTLERELSERILSSYSEVGFSDRFTFGASIPINFVSSGSASDSVSNPSLPSGSLSALGNIGLLGKYTFIDSKWKAAFIANIDFNTSSREVESGLSTGVNAASFQPKLSVGSDGDGWYAFGFFGYGYRNNNYHDFLNYGVELGLKPTEKAMVILNINRWHNLANGDASVDSPENILTGLYTSFQEYNAFLLKLFIKDIYAGIGGFASLGGGSGNSVAASPAITFGVFYDW